MTCFKKHIGNDTLKILNDQLQETNNISKNYVIENKELLQDFKKTKSKIPLLKLHRLHNS